MKYLVLSCALLFSLNAYAQDCKYEKTVTLDDVDKFCRLKQNMFVKGLNLF